MRFGWAATAMLAALALALQVAVPQGFMPARVSGAPTLVICTGHGPALATDLPGAPSKPAKTTALCAFSGHAAALTSVAAPVRAPVRVVYAALTPPAASSASPGRGLAAPPPPSQAPPPIVL
ncbi:MAG TPA: hypothetical protein VKU90_04115 [Caulobacteraceae bacterium]|nr:hypothetical protein [Caulobacteraceae bacterium]